MTTSSPFIDCDFVPKDSVVRISPAEFLGLLLSRLQLERVDRRHLGVRGLKDVKSGALFEIEEQKLFAFQQRSGTTA